MKDVGTPKVQREWVYCQRPAEFEISGCPTCDNVDPDWSEFEGHCWCQKCLIDYVPARSGVFDGPIPVNCAAMLGMTFDRMIIATGKLEIFDLSGKDSRHWIPVEEMLLKRGWKPGTEEAPEKKKRKKGKQ